MSAQSISSSARTCEALFKALGAVLGNEVSQAMRTENLLGRFYVWASFLGTFAAKTVSLDHRLRESPGIRGLVLQLLSLITRHLRLAISSQEEGSNEIPEQLNDGLHFVTKALDRLDVLGQFIRQCSTSSFDRKVDRYTNTHRDIAFEELAKPFVECLYPKASKSLHVHIADSITRRRYRLLYKRRHQESLSRRDDFPDEQIIEIEHKPTKSIETPTAKRVTFDQDTPNTGTQRTRPSSHIEPAPPDTEASTFKEPSPSYIDRIMPLNSSSAYAKSTITFIPSSLDNFPKVPIQRHGKPVVCPYCTQPLKDYQLTTRGWRHHWEDDFQPYICLSEDCQELTFFKRNKDWREHMKTHSPNWVSEIHLETFWRCDMDHEVEDFAVKKQLDCHLKDAHGDLYDEDELAAISDMARETTPRDPGFCPFCNAAPQLPREEHDQANPPNPTANDTESNAAEQETGPDIDMLQHIEGHLRKIAQRSWHELGSEDADSEADEQATSRTDAQALSKGSNGLGRRRDLEMDFPSPSPGQDGQSLSEWQDSDYVDMEPERNPPVEIADWNAIYAAVSPHRLPSEKSETPDNKRRRSLRNAVSESLVRSEFKTGLEFLPEGSIDELFTVESAHKVLKNPDLTAYAMKNARKILAVVLLLDLPYKYVRKGMQEVSESGISDKDLPLTESFWNDRGLPLAEEDGSDELDESVQVWTARRIERFCNHLQWEVLAPVFNIGKLYHDLSPQSVLPFLKKVVKFSGAFGDVSKCEIHPSHLLDPNDQRFQCPKYVAVKELRGAENRQTLSRSWEREASILQKLDQLKQPHILRFLTAFMHGSPGDENYYLMFEWADGGNLRDFWNTFNRPALNADLVKGTMSQILGLAHAINGVHYPPTTAELHFRHGDLKPENILWFKDDGNKNGIGTLKIGGWGLAKQHSFVTELRSFETTTRAGTHIYEPPEEVVSPGGRHLAPGTAGNKRSRLYDIWAMGCITLEFLIWLAYGYEQSEQFIARIIRSNVNAPRFYQVKGEAWSVATVHEVAEQWMDHMARDPIFAAGETALGNLLELVRTRLLVVKLPERLGALAHPEDNMIPRRHVLNDTIKSSPLEPWVTKAEDSDTQETPRIVLSRIEPAEDRQHNGSETVLTHLPNRQWERARSNEFYDSMLEIVGEDEDDRYWFTGLPDPARGPYVDVIYAARQEDTYQAADSALHKELGASWNLEIDNKFAGLVLDSIKSKGLALPDVPPTSKLCDICQTIPQSLWNPDFRVQYDIKELERSADTACDLCRLFWKVHQHQATIQGPTVLLERDGPCIKMNGDSSSVLSISRSPESSIRNNSDIQVGYPGLFQAGSEAYFEIIRHWLRTCDLDHGACQRPAQSFSRHGPLPTRVISVGNPGDPSVRLLETGPESRGEWVALSHLWGAGPKFCTTTTNRGAHMDGIGYDLLPDTFKHAVAVTRALGCPYLWIDSLCIIQGPDGDFNQEARNMERVYGGAYCVLASSRSQGHHAGFLQERNVRNTVALRQDGLAEQIYISENIDDFGLHVLNGSLNKDGWVLEQHALARRTVYFTDHQTYFECGDGFRCETLTKMTNDIANFLGDPQFPEVIMRAPQGERILRCQDLYSTYSRLRLSVDDYRAVAISGIQDRLLKALSVKGGYGIFDEGNGSGKNYGLLRRSLLWRRGDDVSTLERIIFPKSHSIAEVPSWSWMACKGGIDYISPPFGEVDWENVKSPWSHGTGSFNHLQLDEQDANLALTAKASDYNAFDLRDGQGQIIFDRPGGSQQPGTKCVVLGKRRTSASLGHNMKEHYFLLVTSTNKRDRGGYLIYERVGAGYLPGKCIASTGEMIRIR